MSVEGLPDEATLAPGARVVLCGLGSAPHLNGLSGTVGSRRGDRYTVWLRGHSAWKSLRPQNLRPDPFGPRTRVVLLGLVKAAELNGRVGIVASPRDADKGRYEVEVLGKGRKALLESNMRLATPEEAAKAPSCVGVIGPGAGLHANASFWEALRQDRTLALRLEGSSRSAYDRYPENWPGGSPPPNLQSFSRQLLETGAVDAHDVLLFGSRGGQVVLPEFWSECGPEVPPCIVMNGGCLMAGDTPVFWPETVTTLLLIGGCDYFRGEMSGAQYIEFAKRRTPQNSFSTAVLLVDEMDHMPQTDLLALIFREAIGAVLEWRASGSPPTSCFQKILLALRSGGWSGQLSYTYESGGRRLWNDALVSDPGSVTRSKVSMPCDMTRTDPSSSPSYSPKSELSGSPVAGIRRGATVMDISPTVLSPTEFAAPVDYQGLGVGSLVEVEYEQEWYRGTVTAAPHEDPAGAGRWSVQCAADAPGVCTFACAEHIRLDPSSIRQPSSPTFAVPSGESWSPDALKSADGGSRISLAC